MSVALRFQNSTAIAARSAETPDADWVGGCNSPASNAAGVGINIGGGSLPAEVEVGMQGWNWTLEDQYEAIRVPQVSQVIGGLGVTTEAEYPSSGGIDGNGAGEAEYIFAIGNPDNVADGTGSTGPPAAWTPTVLGSANLQTLVAGWVAL